MFILIPQTKSLTHPKVKYRGFLLMMRLPVCQLEQGKFGGFNTFTKSIRTHHSLKRQLPSLPWGNALMPMIHLTRLEADEWGIVMGTSHHEPMLHATTGMEKTVNRFGTIQRMIPLLRDFWKKGIENMGQHESIVTVGMWVMAICP